MSRQLIDLTGRRFGSWTVLRRYDENYTDDGYHTAPQWLCQCDCGEISVVIGNNLRQGKSTGCRKCREEKRLAGFREAHRIRKGFCI